MRPVVIALMALMLCSTASRADEDEIRNNYLLVMQERGGLAAGTRPSCFPAWKTQVVEHHYKACPWDQPRRSKKRRYMSTWDIIEWRW